PVDVRALVRHPATRRRGRSCARSLRRPRRLHARRMGTRIVTSRVRFGFSAPHTRAEVHELEALGAASLWVGGHVASRNPSPEAMVWLARLVEQSETAMIGTAI